MLSDVQVKLVDSRTREGRVAYEDLAPFPREDLDFQSEEAVSGEIAIRGPNVFVGYFDREDLNEEVFDGDGWFFTEDIARVDKVGFFRMVDRADDMVIVGGENVYPAEGKDAF